jgi:hypothetical protein
MVSLVESLESIQILLLCATISPEFPKVDLVAAGDIVDRSDGIKVDSFSCCDRGGKRDLADCSVRGS